MDAEPDRLRLVNIRKNFGELEVLKNVSLTLRRGEVVAIIGVSGSGKSTLLRCVNLLEQPDCGEIIFDGQQVFSGNAESHQLRGPDLSALRAAIGMVFQSFNLWPHKTVLENVIEAPVFVKGVPRKLAIEQAESLLGDVGLAEKRDEYPIRLSGGQQQRVAIVRALAMEPKMMLFDEVTSALDPELVGEVLDLMTDLAGQGMTMLVVTHEMTFARYVSHRTVFIDEGEIVEEGPSDRFFDSPENERTRQFLHRILRDPAPASESRL